MSDKPRVSYADLAWAAAFARIEEGQWLTHPSGMRCRVSWKHLDPDWLELRSGSGKSLACCMIRKGDPMLLELRHE